MKKLITLLFAGLALAVMTGCGTSHKMTARTAPGGKQGAVRQPQRPVITDFKIDPELSSPARRLLAEAKSWLGVPYQYGGNDRQGVDCSGFVTQVFDKALSIKLPRTSATQSEYCTGIDRKLLQPGDLVFFDTTGEREGRVSHVGLYIGDGNMIHASVTRGVTVSDIDGVYFGERLLSGGRVEAFYALERDGNVQEKRVIPAVVVPAEPPVLMAKADPPAQQGITASARPLITANARPAVTPKAPSPLTPRAESAGQARSLVLDMLVEQKLDSIYNE